MTDNLGLYAALAAAQAEYPEIPKRRTAKVKTKTQDGRWVEYSYKYADLSDIMSALRPALTKHGLSILHRTDALDNGKVRLTGILAHSSGQTVEAHMDMSAFPSEGKAVRPGAGISPTPAATRCLRSPASPAKTMTMRTARRLKATSPSRSTRPGRRGSHSGRPTVARSRPPKRSSAPSAPR